MRPRRYPYSGKKESAFVKADPELVEKLLRPRSVLLDSQSLTTRLQANDISVGNSICIDKGRKTMENKITMLDFGCGANTIDELIRGIDSYFDSVNIIGESSLNDYGRGQHDIIFRIAKVLRKIRENEEKASSDA